MNPKVCFLSLNAYPVLTGRNLGYVGGAEVQQVLLARGLVNLGYDVAFVTYGRTGRDAVSVDNIEVIGTYERSAALQYNRLRKITRILRSLDLAGADVYFHMAGAAGILSIYKIWKHVPFVYGVGSDQNALGAGVSATRLREEALGTRLDILTADILITQNTYQQEALTRLFGKKSVSIKNPVPVSKQRARKAEPPTVLWVGTLSRPKRPWLYLKLARAIPEGQFQMVGGRTIDDPTVYASAEAASRSIPNLEFRGFVPYEEVSNYFERASVYVSTSEFEGFPNTFLQAWSAETPVVSLGIDPDGVIARHGLGLASRTFEELVSNVRMLLADRRLRTELGSSGQEYVSQNHDPQVISLEYDRVIQGLLRISHGRHK